MPCSMPELMGTANPMPDCSAGRLTPSMREDRLWPMPFRQLPPRNVARSERLLRYVGWTAEDLEEFAAALRAQRVIDARLWE